MNKNLVCYFSATGTTKNIAQTLSSLIGADLFEIEPVNEYTSKDLDWNDKNSRTTIESEDESIRPEVKSRVENLDNYENIIIGFPVWWYKEAPIVRTFLNKYNLSNKNIYIYATNAGWLGKTFKEIEKLCSNSKIRSEMNIVFESYSDKLVTPETQIYSWIDSIEK